MAPNRKPTSDHDFLRAAYDQLGDASLTYNVQVGFTITPTSRRGVFVVRARAVMPVPNARGRVVAEAEGEYPNSQNGSWTAFLWAIANKLEVRLGEVMGDAIDKA